MLPLPLYMHLIGPLGISGFAAAGLVGLAAGYLLTLLVLRTVPARFRAAALAAFTPVLVGLVVGGRIANQLWTQDLMWSAPLTWLQLAGTSLSYAGGLLGALVALTWSVRGGTGRTRTEEASAIADALAPGAAAALAIGWLGVPVLGHVTKVPWALPVAPGVGVQPVQVYGLLAFGAVAAWLAWQHRHLDYTGQNLVTFIVLMSAFHFIIGFTEQTPTAWGPWSLAQVADVALVLAGIGLGAWLQRLPAAVREAKP